MKCLEFLQDAGLLNRNVSGIIQDYVVHSAHSMRAHRNRIRFFHEIRPKTIERVTRILVKLHKIRRSWYPFNLWNIDQLGAKIAVFVDHTLGLSLTDSEKWWTKLHAVHIANNFDVRLVANGPHPLILTGGGDEKEMYRAGGFLS